MGWRECRKESAGIPSGCEWIVRTFDRWCGRRGDRPPANGFDPCGIVVRAKIGRLIAARLQWPLLAMREWRVPPFAGAGKTLSADGGERRACKRWHEHG